MSKHKYNINDEVMTPFGGGKIKEVKLYNKKVYYVVKMNGMMNLVLRESVITK